MEPVALDEVNRFFPNIRFERIKKAKYLSMPGTIPSMFFISSKEKCVNMTFHIEVTK